MKTTHTPGPWHVQPDPEWAGKHPLHDNRFITCGNPDITSEEWQHDPKSYIIASMRDCQNQKANARLIAAAPELLAACKAIVDDLEDCGEIFGTDERRISFLREAISKAESNS